jgi:hypothetical protein
MISIGRLIEKELRNQERTVTWLARQINCERSNVYKIFERDSIDTEQLMRISNALGKNFFAIYNTEFKNLPSPHSCVIEEFST